MPTSLAICDIVTERTPLWVASVPVASRIASRTSRRCDSIVVLHSFGTVRVYGSTGGGAADARRRIGAIFGAEASATMHLRTSGAIDGRRPAGVAHRSRSDPVALRFQEAAGA